MTRLLARSSLTHLALALSVAIGTTGCSGRTTADPGAGAGGSEQSGAGGGAGTGAGTGGSSGSGSGGGAGDAGNIKVVEIGTWWSGMREIKGLEEVFNLHKKAHPDVRVNVVSFADEQNLQNGLTQRFVDGNPYGLFQANLGGGALAWGPTTRAVAASATWLQAFPAAVLDQLSYSGRLIGVPLALSRQNVAYWNLKALNTLNLIKKIPETTDELYAWLGEVSAAGYTHPLCFSGKDAWVSAHVLFNHVLPAVAGPEFSRHYWQGKMAADDPNVFAALDAMKKLVGHLSTDWIDLDMSAGINKLMANESDPSQQCLVTPMGDWGGAILAETNMPEVDFVGTGWPGAKLVTVFGGDAFLVSLGASNQGAIDALVDTMASEDAQIAFSRQRANGMPARQLTQVPPTLDTLTLKNVADLSNPGGTVVAGFRSIAKRTYPLDVLSTRVSEFFQSKDPNALLQFLRDNYSTLK